MAVQENMARVLKESRIEPFDTWKESIIDALPKIVLAIGVIIIFWMIAGLVGKYTRRILSKSVKNLSIATLAASFARALTIGAGIFIALTILGLDQALTALLTGAGVAGLAVGFAVQNPMGNTFAGVLLSFRDNINIGDWVESNGFSGEVVNLDLKATTLKGADNNIIVLPNKMVLENPYKNHTLTKRTFVEVAAGVAYDSDLKKVKEVVLSTLEQRFPNVHKEDILFVYDEFADSSINFKTRFWMDAQKAIDAIHAKSDAIIAIQEAFDREGINIPFPIRTVISDA